MSVYGPEKISFTRIVDKINTNVSLDDLLYTALFEKSKSENEGWVALSSSGPSSQVFSKFEHSTIGYGFYCFRNKSNKDIEVTLKATVRNNLKFCELKNVCNFSKFSIFDDFCSDSA